MIGADGKWCVGAVKTCGVGREEGERMVMEAGDVGTKSRGVSRGARALPRVLLASRSPRRRALLTEYGVPHDAEHPGFDDAILRPTGVSAEQWVASLAYLKASAGAAIARSRGGGVTIVLGADTTCEKNGKLLGTPADGPEARAMLRELSNGEHRVLTGVALVESRDGTREDVRHVFVDSATVRMGALSDEQIDEYVESGGWRGKAGAYNLAERLEAGWPIEYTGDPTTIMGLPMGKLVPALERLIPPDASPRV